VESSNGWKLQTVSETEAAHARLDLPRVEAFTRSMLKKESTRWVIVAMEVSFAVVAIYFLWAGR
jgi:hypothetical protein